jgi:hypothetical protein
VEGGIVKANFARLFFVLAPAVLAASPPQGSPPFSLTIEPARETFRPDSQVELKLTLKNTSTREISIRDTNRWCDYGLEVRGGGGQPAPETPYKLQLDCGFHVTIGRRVIKILRPGESYDDAMFVNQIYNLSRPGKYTIQASREIPKEIGQGTVKSNIVTVTVTEQ